MLAQRLRRFPAARQYRLPAGSVLFHQHEFTQEVIAVDTGLSKVTWRMAGTGQPFIFLAKPGLILAQTATSWDAATPISASAITECSVYKVPVAAYIDILVRDEELLWTCPQF